VRGLVSLLWLLLAFVASACEHRVATDRPARSSGTPAVSSSQVAAAPPAVPEPRSDSLTLLTYNVLATPIYAKLRTGAVLDILERSQADVIALQEVAPWMLGDIVGASWARGYHLVTQGGRAVAPGGQLILTRHPIVEHRVDVLPGRQRRIVLLVVVEIDGRRLGVATSHMESFLEDGPIRAMQLRAMFPMLEGVDDAVLLGDMNFGDGEEPETSTLDPRYRDAWLALKAGDPGMTWRNDDNPIAGFGAFVGEPNRRLDRILLRSEHWEPASIRIIGNHPAGKRDISMADWRRIAVPQATPPRDLPRSIDVFPSDHYGLVARYRVRDKAGPAATTGVPSPATGASADAKPSPARAADGTPKLWKDEPSCQCSPNDLLCRASCQLDAEACGCPDRQVSCMLDCLERAEAQPR
jgi:endonuclease/exonuclease/phosphatase family metal-dependent hydrolase